MYAAPSISQSAVAMGCQAESPTGTARPAAGNGESVFVFGCGYTAARVIQRLRKAGRLKHVWGTCRTAEGTSLLHQKGIVPYVYSPADGSSLCAAGADALTSATLVLDSTPSVSHTAGESPPELASRCRGGQRWLGYLSTTSVYGDHGGSLVSEQSPLLASDARSQSRVAAEQAWLDLYAQHGLPVHVFRLAGHSYAGIYGPGRSALDAVRKLSAGASSTSTNQSRRMLAPYTSRVHVDDICRAVAASMAAPGPGAIYNVVDDDPTSRHEAMRFACQLLGVDPATLPEQPPADPISRGSSKRVSNAKLKEDLNFVLEYPTYREGLAAILASEYVL